MRPELVTAFWLPIIALLSCTPEPPGSPLQSTFFLYRFDPPALVEFSTAFEPIREIRISLPANCGLFNVFAPPIGRLMAIELSCPSGQTVLFVDTDQGTALQPVKETDSHLLAWAQNGEAAYLRVDSLGRAHIARLGADGTNEFVPITEFTYDLAVNPRNEDFTFTFSRGLGRGSELWLAKYDGKIVQQLTADPLNYISFARYSPDGRQIAFIKIPDTQIPFSVGELWVMDRDGSNGRKLADVDAGHGYAANWSPHGEQIAFVMRENPEDERADHSSELLISNIYIVDVGTGVLEKITTIETGWTETPVWSPDGNSLAFNVVINDRMEVRIAGITTREIRSLQMESTCCPAWVRK